MEHLHGNQYETKIGSKYDIECLLLYVDLSDFCNNEFGTDFVPSERILNITKKLRGKRVYGNSQYPDRFYVKTHTWSPRYELRSRYHYEDVDKCCATYGDKTREELIAIVEDIHNYVKDHELFDISFKSLMGRYDMKYICNAGEVANDIVKYYGAYVTDTTDGLNAYLQKTGKTEIAFD